MKPRPYDLLSSVLTWLTVLAALLSWRSFTIDPHSYLDPAALLGAVIVGVGATGRMLRLRADLIVLLQLVVGGAAADLAVFGNPVPLGGAARSHVLDVFNSAYDTVVRSPLPVPVGDGGVAPYLVFGAAAAFLLVDVLVARLRRPPLAGLVLLALFSVPFGIVGGGVAWWVFALTAAGFLGLLGVQQRERIARWGRHLDDAAGAGIAPHAPGPLKPVAAVSPSAIGVTATALAIIVPLFVPTLHLDLSGLGPGSGSGGPIRVTNPTVGMYDDLRSRSDTPLVYVRPDRPDAAAPSYLRIATLTSFNGHEWTPGGRSILPAHTARTSFPPPESDPSLLGPETTYHLTATPDFQSRWLPTFYYTTKISAHGDWRYDPSTLDFMAADRDGGLTTAGESWTVTAAPVEPSTEQLMDAPFDSSGVSSAYTQLPHLDPEIARIARQKTAAESTPFGKAVALQDWFHSSGEFTYSLDRPGGTSTDDLLHFVTDEKVGYCQQFATAMAVMARELGIPARVAVGFLNPSSVGGGNYLFRGRDMHAWPELWFEGVGWVRFEPTPGAADTTVPDYTLGVLDAPTTSQPDGSTATGPESLPGQAAPSARPGVQPEHAGDQGTTPGSRAGTGQDGHGTLIALVAVAALLMLLALALGLPWWLRLRRRARRLRGGPEDGWAELRDTVRDLGLPWSEEVSPRMTAVPLARELRTERTRAALERLVVAVERSRYARAPSHEAVGDDVRVVIDGLLTRTDRAQHRRALLWPRSVFSPVRRRPSQPQHEPELVDHMG